MNHIQQKFEEFHANNPQVYQAFRDLAIQVKKSGKNEFSSAMIFERMRWTQMIETEGGDGYKINNNFRAYYARKLMDDDPENFFCFFKTKNLSA